MAPLLRTLAVFLSFAFGIIGLGVGINALHKSNQQKDYVKLHATSGVSVNIDTSGAPFSYLRSCQMY